MEKPDSNVILNCRYSLVNNYLAKGFVIFENNSKQLSSLLNDVKLRIHVIDKLETDFVVAKNTEISSVANTKNKFHIQSDLHLIYKQKFYHDKEREINKPFDEYHLPLLQDIDHPVLIQ